MNADGRVCLWAFAWVLAFGAIYPLNRNKGGGGKSYRPWQQKNPLFNCKPAPGRSESAREMAACAADVSIIANNLNVSRAEAVRGASAFVQIDEREAVDGRIRFSTASRRRFALLPFVAVSQLLQKNTSRLCIPPLS